MTIAASTISNPSNIIISPTENGNRLVNLPNTFTIIGVIYKVYQSQKAGQSHANIFTITTNIILIIMYHLYIAFFFSIVSSQ